MTETSFFKRTCTPQQSFILIIYFIGVLIFSVYVPWHAISGHISEGTGAIIQEDYLGYDFLWSRPQHGRWLIEIDLATVFLEIIALTATVSIISLAPEAWKFWQSRSNT